MVDHAIVIGIDHYIHQPTWTLACAVRDAERFAQWLLEPDAERVRPDTLTLLLSPSPTCTPELPFEPATAANIKAAFLRYMGKDARAADASRLWVFYAGHGAAPPGSAPNAGPFIIPCDVESLELYFSFDQLPLAKLVQPLQLRPPREQVFFIDACRGIVQRDDPLTSSTQFHLDLGKLRPHDQPFSSQAVLFATAPGQLASERGLHGIFTEALLEGLQGRGPVLVGDPVRGGAVLTFENLRAFVDERVRARIERSLKTGEGLAPQSPSASEFTAGERLAMVHFEPSRIPRAALSLMIRPPAALSAAQAGVLMQDINFEFSLDRVQGPPAPARLTWSLPYRTHRIQVRATGFETWEEPVRLIHDLDLEVVLKRKTVVRGTPRGASLESELRAGLEPEARGDLVVSCPDEKARMVLFAPDGGKLAAATGGLRLARLPVGDYRLETRFPSQEHVVEPFLLTAKGLRLSVKPRAAVTQGIARALEDRGIVVNGSFTEPSETFGPTMTSLIGSVLAWASWASRFPFGHGEKLRRLGLDSLQHAAPLESYLQVIVADATDSAHELLSSLELRVGRGKTDETAAAFAAVPGLPGVAAQWSGRIDMDGATVVLRARGLEALALPVPYVPGHVLVVVVARERDGQLDVHRYLHPLHPAQSGSTFSAAIRDRERLWRGLVSREAFLPAEAEAALEQARELDPLTLAILGYRLAREGRFEVFVRTADATPLAELWSRCPELPDTQVLMAMAATDHHTKLAHLAEASRLGGPIVADGYALILDFLTQRAATLLVTPPIPLWAPRTHPAWSAFDADARVDASPRVFPMSSAMRGSRAWVHALERAAAATARVRGVPGHDRTGFLITPSLLMTAGPQFDESAHQLLAYFDADAPTRLVLPTAAGHGAFVGTLAGGGVHREPVVHASSRPTAGQRIAVIGFVAVHDDFAWSFARLFAELARGEQVVVPGTVKEVSDTHFTFEAHVLYGAMGGPVVDFASGAVLGIQTGYREEDGALLGHAAIVPPGSEHAVV